MITLYFKEGASDKVYQVEVVSNNGGYDVNFAYGRRGSTMNTGKKNTSPLSKSGAEELADKLVKEKMAKGYTPGEDGTPYKSTNNEGRNTGIYPMLLNAISEEEVPIFIADEAWMLQAKFDGKRMMIRKVGDKIDAINRSGLIIGAPQGILDEIAEIPGNFILDGEAIGDIYYAFDIIEEYTILYHRLAYLRELLSQCRGSYVNVAPWYTTYQSKDYYAALFKSTGAEGIVFKKLTSCYTPGRPSTGGVALKCKFTSTANVRVTGINIQRSVEIALEDGTPCGNVSVPPNKTIPNLNDIIEVRYLYAMPASHALYQPFYSRLRDDIIVADNVGQLKFKKDED